MTVTLLRARARQCDVERLAFECGGLGLCSELFRETRYFCLNLRIDFIHLPAKFRSLIRGDGSDSLFLGGDKARLSTDILIAQRSQSIRVCDRLQISTKPLQQV